ncbi:MAG: gliding motility-associated ABC transporter substrate-binding protein GldG [Phaeodactylibacter sp.]|nr:gliding motility-associated ABC transporter substrate-binding protein GldG [Phaeodactylibacter sp.]MCB9300781.1 gliding motility-associated ABC transporter substrate-binding protein GldG [Lewinellaceae bacterium]
MTKKKNSKKIQSLIQLGLLLGIVLFLNILANARINGRAMYTYLDMTEEKRFTLTDASRRLLKDLDDVVYVKVLLDGDFPAGFRRLQSATQDMLDDFRSVSGFVEYDFENPNDGSVKEINARREQLAKDGINPINLRVKGVEGTEERQIYPYAVVYYKNRNIPVNLLENEVPGVPPEVILNNSVSLLEYKLANAIQKLQAARKPNILFTKGHGELMSLETADLEKTLREFYETGRIDLDSVVAIGPEASALVIAKPTRPFSEKDKFKLDQYVMNGGKVLWLLDRVRVDLDSLRGRSSYYPNEYDLNLDDLLFRYGVRIQPDLVLDVQCSRIPLATGMVGNAPQFDYFRYPYHLVVAPRIDHPIVKSLGAINLRYPSSIDTSVIVKTNLKKTVLLESSPNSRLQFLPVEMNFEFLREDLKEDKFNKPPQPLALLLEGDFPSMYENRVTESLLEGLKDLGLEYKAHSGPNKMIVVSDGDIARNKVNLVEQSYSPLGYNEFERYLFANKDFIVNSLEYLLDDKGVIEARGKEVRLRLLDTVRAKKEKGFWQGLNIISPLAFLAIFGLIFNWLRRRKYGRKI